MNNCLLCCYYFQLWIEMIWSLNWLAMARSHSTLTYIFIILCLRWKLFKAYCRQWLNGRKEDRHKYFLRRKESLKRVGRVDIEKLRQYNRRHERSIKNQAVNILGFAGHKFPSKRYISASWVRKEPWTTVNKWTQLHFLKLYLWSWTLDLVLPVVVLHSCNRLLSSTGKGSGLVFFVICQDFECQQEILVSSRWEIQ